MKIFKITLACLFTLVIQNLMFSQSNKVLKLIEEGEAYHRLDNTKEALEKYEKAYKIEPDNLMVNYYMAFANSDLGNSEEAYKYSKAIIGKGGEYEELAYVFNGAALVEMGKLEAALNIFYEGLGKYLYNGSLHYNLAYTAMKLGRLEFSYESIINSIKVNPIDGSSHNIFGQLTYNSSKTYSFYGFLYTLLMTDETDSSKEIMDLIVDILEGGNNIETDELYKISFVYEPKDLQNDNKALEKADKKLNSIIAKCKANAKTNDLEEFNRNLTDFITEMYNIKNEEKLTGFFWEYYVDFFYELVKAGHGEALSYKISMPTNHPMSEKWFQNNMTKFNEMYFWIEKYYNEK